MEKNIIFKIKKKEKIKMENKEYKFKTNINCGGCIANVTPFLDKAEGISKWNVDTTDKNKILTIESNGISLENIIKIINQAGYKAEPI